MLGGARVTVALGGHISSVVFNLLTADREEARRRDQGTKTVAVHGNFQPAKESTVQSNHSSVLVTVYIYYEPSELN